MENLKFSCICSISQEVEVMLWLPAIKLKGKLNYLNLSTGILSLVRTGMKGSDGWNVMGGEKEK